MKNHGESKTHVLIGEVRSASDYIDEIEDEVFTDVKDDIDSKNDIDKTAAPLAGKIDIT